MRRRDQLAGRLEQLRRIGRFVEWLELGGCALWIVGWELRRRRGTADWDRRSRGGLRLQSIDFRRAGEPGCLRAAALEHDVLSGAAFGAAVAALQLDRRDTVCARWKLRRRRGSLRGVHASHARGGGTVRRLPVAPVGRRGRVVLLRRLRDLKGTANLKPTASPQNELVGRRVERVLADLRASADRDRPFHSREGVLGVDGLQAAATAGSWDVPPS